MAWRTSALLAAAVVMLAAAPAALAAPEAPDPKAPETAAEAEFAAGMTEYNLAHFTEAAALFEKAYKLDPAPIILFNIGQCHRKLGDAERALFFFRRYLDEDPTTPKRAEVEKRMTEMRARLAAAAPVAAPAAPVAAPAPTPTVAVPTLPAAPAATPGTTPDPSPADGAVSANHGALPWASLAATTLALGFGAYETSRWISSASEFNGLADPTTHKALCGAADANHGADPRCHTLYDQMSTSRGLAIGGLGVGAGLGVVTYLLFRHAPAETTGPAATAARPPAARASSMTTALSCGPAGGATVGLLCAARF